MELLEKTRNLLLEHYKNGNSDRLNHIFGVEEMAAYLAKIYNVDEQKARIAALMHDYCKYDDYKKIEEMLTEDEIVECRYYPFLYHAYGSAYTYKKLIGDDNDIFNAIYNHVFGRCGMSKLEEIIMISDYTEKNRKYEDCIKAREILLKGNLYEAIVYSLEHTMLHVVKNGENPHPRQLAVYNEYLEKIGVK